MNKTALFLGSAVVLALVALVVGLPRSHGQTTTTTVATTPLPPTPPTSVGNGSLTMTGRLSHPYVGMGQSDVFVSVDVEAVDVPGAKRSPVNLAMVIDRSGSMSGFKLTQAKQAARQLISQLTADDHLTIVHYGSDVKQLGGLFATETNKETMRRYVDGIWDDGGTNIGDGLTVALQGLARTRSDFRVNRLILISDGQPTEGITEFSGLTDIVRRARNQGVSTSSIGVGDDFNEQLMEAFAEIGAGAYAYLQDASQLAVIFQKDLNAAGTQVAKRVSLTFRVPQGARLQEVLGYKTSARILDGDAERVTVDLPDFSASQKERVVAHFTVDGARLGEAIDVSGLSLDYTDLMKDTAVKSTAQLSAMVTDRPDVVAEKRDKEAVVFAARARGALNMRSAAEALKAGKKEEAEKYIQANAFYFEEAAQVAGPAAVAADVADQKVMLDEVRDAEDTDSVNAFSKGARTKARKDFGLMGSTY